METVADKKDLPHIFLKENDQHIPMYSVLFISVFAGALAVFGSLSLLVDAASLIFLFTFGTVNVIGYLQQIRFRYLSLAGAAICVIAIGLSAYAQLRENPVPFLIMMCLVGGIFLARPVLLRKFVSSNND